MRHVFIQADQKHKEYAEFVIVSLILAKKCVLHRHYLETFVKSLSSE